jgi:quinohemoprotein ethanol dehydrogenase
MANGRGGWYAGFLEAGMWLLFVALLVPAVLVGYVIGQDRSEGEGTATVTVSQAQAAEAERKAIKGAPAFSADDLAKDPEDAWITNGGSLSNQRYSPLDEIDTGNVEELKGVWMTNLRGSATAAKYSAEAQPIVYEGVMYVPTGSDEVFAVSVKSGDILWHYDPKLDQTINTVCCGWLSRGVAIGDGRVYIGQLDGKLVALDQKTGEVAWSTEVGSWKQGYTITNAPLYYDGMVVTGISGGEFSIRGRVQAYDAKTGKQIWRFHTIPGPGEIGHDTWPANSEAWKRGGAPVWQTPAVDPGLGLLYFSTGNASPDLDGSRRAGDNLFTASIVAVEAKTGKYRWHFQQVRHDIWDYDAPSPVVLFDVDGKKGLGQASKTGWLYLLDRETGKPLYDIPDKPVPQLPAQKTAKTQPIPSYPPFVPHTVSDEGYAQIAKLVKKNSKGKPVPKIKRAEEMYTPFGNDVTVVTPGPQGGTNWPPISYNQDTEMFYVCAQSGVAGYTRTGRFLEDGKQGAVADLGSVLTLTGFGNQVGYLSAIDANSGEVKWQKRWPESCYSGTVTTGGGLVFVGRNGGALQAYDAENGDLLWSFQTGAGANTTPTVFEQDGKEYVAFYAGGNSLAASPHGDNLWLFSLDGTLGPAKAGGAGEGTGHAGEAPEQPTNAGAGNATAGKQVYAENCSVCHGADGGGGNGGPSLESSDRARQVDQVIAQVTNGGGGMPSFKGQLTEQQIRDVSAYVSRQLAQGK